MIKLENKQNIPFSPPDISDREIENVVEVLKSGWITTGPKTKEFEKKISEYCNTDKTVCLNSSTAAMEMTLRMLGIGEGDEVITSSYTYTASCSVICHVGAKPILVDIGKDNLEMNYDRLEEAITEKTKAIIPVDIAGVICDYDRINAIVENKKYLFVPKNEIQKSIGRISIIADASHAFGAIRDGKKAGELADFTCFSFHAVKNLTTGEGGAVTWKDKEGLNSDEIYKRFQILSLHGQTKDALHKNSIGAWEYDILEPAYKCNMTDIMAAIGIAQLDRYDEMLKRRHEIINKYNSFLSSHYVQVLNHEDENNYSSGHLYIVKINGIEENTRNEIINKMAEKGIATNVHYKPLPLLTAYKNLGFDIADFENSYNFYKGEITLPLYTKLTDEQVEYIINNFVDILKEYDI